MTNQQVTDILKEAGVILEGHFLLTSGRHSDKYLQCAKIFLNNKYSEPLCMELAKAYSSTKIDVVIGPALGAVLMAYEMGRCLGVPNLFTERADGKMCLRRGFELKPGEKVLVVEDVVTTGGSVREVIEIVKASGAEVVGVGAIVDRTGGEMDFGTDFKSVISMKVESYAPESCPICKQTGSEPVKPGSRATIK